MALSEKERKEFKELISNQIDKSFRRGCLCGINESAVKHQKYFWQMLEDVSDDGNIGKSLDILRSMIKAHKRIGKFGMWIAYVVISVISAGTIWAFWEGFKVYVSKIRG